MLEFQASLLSGFCRMSLPACAIGNLQRGPVCLLHPQPGATQGPQQGKGLPETVSHLFQVPGTTIRPAHLALVHRTQSSKRVEEVSAPHPADHLLLFCLLPMPACLTMVSMSISVSLLLGWDYYSMLNVDQSPEGFARHRLLGSGPSNSDSAGSRGPTKLNFNQAEATCPGTAP